MKIYLIGKHSGNLAEGMKNITHHFRENLSKRHEIMVATPKEALRPDTITKMRRFHPEIIHYVHGPSIKSLAVLKYLSKMCRGSRAVISATHPVISGLQKRFVSVLKPGLVLAQSRDTAKFFRALGCKTEFLPMSGVDLRRFVSAEVPQKALLRKKYGLKEDAFIMLHIGTIHKNRNLQIFETMQKEIDGQVLIVGSTEARADKDLLHSLRKSGCTVWLKYFPNIEELYALSDVYIFPTVNPEGSIEIPLTVLEAMSCNLPVIASRFGGLIDLFREDNGFYFYRDCRDMRGVIKKMMRGNKINNREKVLRHSWENVGGRLEESYNLCLQNRQRFICFIGIDGSGKTTLAKKVTEELNHAGRDSAYAHGLIDVKLLKPLMALGKTLLLKPKMRKRGYSEVIKEKRRQFSRYPFLFFFYKIALFFDYAPQIAGKIIVPLRRGQSVISDRYVHDTLINLTLNKGHDLPGLKKLINNFLRIFPKPDITFFIDLPEEIAFSRKNDIYDIESLKEKRILYRRLAEAERMPMLDGKKPIEDLVGEVMCHIDRVEK